MSLSPSSRIEVRPGLTKRRNPDGWLIAELDYWADESKGPEWLQKQRKGMDSRLFAREILRDWGSAAGNPFYPEYQLYGGDRTHVKRATYLIPDQPIRRGWDFGERHPACVWAQYDPRTKRDWVLRELMMPEQEVYWNIHTFRDLVLYLSGELPYHMTSDVVKDKIRILREDDHYGKLPMPWFAATGARPIQWLDFSGHEASQPAPGVAEESLEQTKADILATRGIYLQQHYGAVRAGADILRRLLAPLKDGWGGVLFDPAAPVLRDGVKTHVTYEIGTPQRPEREVPRKDGFYEHPHEAYLYTLPSIVPLGDEDWERGDTVGKEGERVRHERPAETLGFYETDNPDPWA